jgi:UDP-N-acetylmuramoyl-tripeptide--D-alanyl-D-alanine ligase
MGMNAPGEIARLTQVAEPEVGLITCVAAAHLAGLGSLERVAQAKVELLAGLPPQAAAIINGDDGPLSAAAAPYLTGRPSYRFGTGANSDVRLLTASHVPHHGGVGLAIALDIGGRTHKATLPLVGQHNGMNAAAAVACALALKLDVEAALEDMATVQIPGARGRIVHVPRLHLHLLDDCYNANPHSMAAAIATLQDLGQQGATAAVFGDMLELGPEAAAHHEALGIRAARAGIRHIFALGEFAERTVAGARQEGASAQVLQNIEAATDSVSQLPPGAWCLVKGSRGMHLERLVEALTAQPSPPSPPT